MSTKTKHSSCSSRKKSRTRKINFTEILPTVGEIKSNQRKKSRVKNKMDTGKRKKPVYLATIGYEG